MSKNIGINDYHGSNNDLSDYVNDADDRAAELDRRGMVVSPMLDAEANR